MIGYSSFPEVVSCRSCFGSESSNGKRPHTMVYRTTPRLQTSLAMPSYGIPNRQDHTLGKKERESCYTVAREVFLFQDSVSVN